MTRFFSFYFYPQVYRPVTTVAPPARYVARVSGDANAQTLKYSNDVAPDGSYNYLWGFFSLCPVPIYFLDHLNIYVNH